MNSQRLNNKSKLESYLAKDLIRKFNIVYGSITTPTIIYDEESLEILGANNSALRFYGLSRNDLLNELKNRNSNFQKNNMVKILPKLTQYVDYINSWKHYDQNGHFCEMQITSYSLTLAERNVRVVLIRDITLQKHWQENIESSIN
jgi:PAS domain-containing protein